MKKKVMKRSRRREPKEVTEQKPEIGEALNGIVKERFNKSKGCSKKEQKDNAVLKGTDTKERK
jgi:hypothetical protein